jgi:filamentous hemagglutinin family protein
MKRIQDRRNEYRSFAVKALCAAVAAVFAETAGAQALPTGGTVTAGTATIGTSGSAMTVTQTSQRAIIDWASFNIGNGASVTFAQPGASSIAVSRSGPAANIDGALSANGHLLILSPNGVLFGANARVNVGGLIASTGNINDNQFMNGVDGSFAITGATTGSVSNQGHITVSGAGLAAFVAPSVTNSGTIQAIGGRIRLASAQAATISLNNGLYEIVINQGIANGTLTNTGTLTTGSATGSIILSALDAANVVSGTINLEGVQQASRIEVHGGHVVLKSDLDAAVVTGTSRVIDVCGCASIQDAVDIAKVGTPGAGATVNVQGGSHSEQVTINKAGLKLLGQAGAKLVVPNGTQVNGITIGANDVTVSGFEIAGPVTSSYLTYLWGSNITRGIAVGNGITGFTIANNNIHDVRNGILIDGRNAGFVNGNRIENTKSAISVQYTDGAGIAISGNKEGPIGNEWGVNLHLNGFLENGTIFTNPHAASPTLGQQQALLDLSNANGGWGVQDQGYTSSNRTRVAVATNGTANAQGSLLTPLNSIQSGIDAVVAGGVVNVGAGTFTQGTTLNVNKRVTLAGAGEASTIIDARTVVNNYGMLVTADHVWLHDFTFYGPSANVGNAYGIKVQPAPGPGLSADSRLYDFKITNVTSRGAGRAELDLNGVVGATIDHFTADGAPVGIDNGTTAGAGIQITDSSDVTITSSKTRNNAWGGVALFQGNKFFNQQTTRISVENNNVFAESNPLYLQDESASQNFGDLNLPGFKYAVRNTATVGSGSDRVDYSQFTWMQAAPQGAFNLAVNLLAPNASYIQGWSGTALTQTFHVGVGSLTAGGTRNMSIMTAVDRADPGALINIYPGAYTETAANRVIHMTNENGVSSDGVYTLGLFLDKNDMTLRGVNASGNAITNADDVQAWITAGAITDFGMAHGVMANNVTFEGLGFKPKTDDLNKTIEIGGDNFTFRNSVVDNRPSPGGTTKAGGAGALYFGELDPVGHPMTKLTVTGSKFYDGSVTITNGVGVALDGVTYAPASQRVISGNRFIGSGNFSFAGVSLTGKMGEIDWRRMGIGAVTITGNSFSGFDDSVLVRGEQQGVDLRQVMRDNSFDRSVLVTDAAGNARGELYGSSMSGNAPFFMRPKYSIQSSIGAGLNRSLTGDTVAIGPGTYAESIVLNGLRNLTFNGSTIQGLTINPGAAGSGIGGSATANTALGFRFDAPIVLLSDTTLATTGADIVLNGDIQGAGGNAFALSLMAGPGNVSLASGGTPDNPLGHFDNVSNDFSLSGTLWVTGFNIGASGDVSLSDHSLHATQSGSSNAIAAGGTATGTVFSESPLVVNAGEEIRMRIDAPAAIVRTTGRVDIVNLGSSVIDVNGRPQTPATMSNTDPARLLPSESAIAGNSAKSKGPDGASAPSAPSSLSAAFAGEALDQGRSVEINLAPGYGRGR